jgi:mRNA interferase RelE/StbE
LAYKAVWHERALSDLKALERTTAGKIIERVKNHPAQNPEKFSKPLKGVLRGLYRYRWGDYRIVFTTDQSERTLKVLHVRHRKDAYR